MYYVDSQRTVTRRESSLVVPKRYNNDPDFPEGLSTGRAQSTARLFTESSTSLPVQRARGSVRKELVSMMFDSMLDSILDSWEVIHPPKEDSSPNFEFGKSPSELTVAGKKKKSAGPVKSKIKRSRSKLDFENEHTDPLQQCWWSSPDERAVIRFRNGNVYEGSISMKCMHGEGRYQWADGTVYLGHFKDNDINGKGIIQWKDDTWYEGDFIGNLRHGRGLYVDSRRQRSYCGGWYCGTKHGEGVIYYSNTSSYDGEWIHNVRHGFGSREYCSHSGYKGEWDQNVREGKGLMIWPNHDFYRGEWKNGVMSGYGIYIWDAYCNNTLALPSINAYRGLWVKGQRNGYGVLNLGLGHGSHYKGEFKNNRKHGVGKFISNNGLILQGKNLFLDDNIAPLLFDSNDTRDNSSPQQLEPYRFDICDSTVGMLYHIEQALDNVDKQVEIRTNMINEYIENNKSLEVDMAAGRRSGGQCFPFPSPLETEDASVDVEDLINFEEISLLKSLRCYETDLKNIYYKYATICNTEEILFTPVLIRLFLWQFYFDCNVHERGLNLVDIDRIFHQNPEWLSRNAHNPFEKIYFWQFLHSLISVARILYAKKELPGTKPDTILASAFRMFMEKDVLPGAGRRRGKLANGYVSLVPLKGLYKLYRSLGEPHTVRTFLCAVRSPPHWLDRPQATLVETPDDALPLGRNVYIFGDDITFFTDDHRRSPEDEWDNEEEPQKSEYKLFNFANLSNKAIIKIFAEIFPEISTSGLIMNLDVEITFYEFFEAFFACAEESIRVKDEEIRWRERFSENDEAADAAAAASQKIKK